MQIHNEAIQIFMDAKEKEEDEETIELLLLNITSLVYALSDLSTLRKEIMKKEEFFIEILKRSFEGKRKKERTICLSLLLSLSSSQASDEFIFFILPLFKKANFFSNLFALLNREEEDERKKEELSIFICLLCNTVKNREALLMIEDIKQFELMPSFERL